MLDIQPQLLIYIGNISDSLIPSIEYEIPAYYYNAINKVFYNIWMFSNSNQS